MGNSCRLWGIWAFFRKKGNFELYTDPESQIKQFKRIRTIFFRWAIVEFLISILAVVQRNPNKGANADLDAFAFDIDCLYFPEASQDMHKENNRT